MSDTLWNELRALMPSPLPHGFPRDKVVLFPPKDNAAQALQLLIGSLDTSVNLSMFTYTDKKLHALLKTKAQTASVDFKAVFDEGCYNQIPSMKTLVDDFADPRVMVGKSEHGQIIHRKILVGDHEYVVGGSTNWTFDGEALEDNELVIVRSVPLAGFYEATLTANWERLQALKPPAPTASAPTSATAA